MLVVFHHAFAALERHVLSRLEIFCWRQLFFLLGNIDILHGILQRPFFTGLIFWEVLVSGIFRSQAQNFAIRSDMQCNGIHGVTICITEFS